MSVEMCEIGSQGTIITNAPDKQTETNIAKSASWKDAVSYIIGSKGKKTIIVLLTIIVIVGIWMSLVACGVSVFLLDRIEPNNNNNQISVINSTSSYSFDDLPIVYIFVSKIFNNDPQALTEVYEIRRHELNISNNITSVNFSVPHCNTTNSRYNCPIQDILIAYLFPLLKAPKVVTSGDYLLFDFSNVSIAKEDSIINSNVIVLDSNATNSSNTLQNILFGVNVNCPEDHQFNSMIQSCVPNNFIEAYWHPSGNTGRTILRIGIACITITGLISSIVSLSTFLLRPFSEESSTGTGKQESKVQKFFKSLLTPSLLFLYLFASFCVILLVIFDLPDPSDTYQKLYETKAERILLNLYGALFHFGIFGFFFWVNFTLFNLLLTLLYPVEMSTRSKLRVWIIAIELVVSIAVPILLVIITLAIREGYPYFPIYIWLVVTDSDFTASSLPSLVLYFVPLILSCLGILTLTPLIVCKIKWNVISSDDLKIHRTKLSGLQFRILLYAILMFLIFLALLIGLILYILIYQSGTLAIFSNEFRCLTASRPASLYRNGNLELYNTTLDALKSMRGTNDVINQYEHDCYRVEKTNSIHPGWLYIMEAFLIRILVICIFIVTLPSKSNYYTWKNAISRTLGCCKRSKKKLMSSQEK